MKLVDDATTLYADFSEDMEFEKAAPMIDRDPRVDLVLVAACVLLKLAGVGMELRRHYVRASDLDAPRLLQAVALVDSQLRRTPSDVPLRLLLVQLYLHLGCGAMAYELWLPMDVKRTVLDALGPLFFDRLSSIAPYLFQTGNRPLMEHMRSYYSALNRRKAPVRIWDAFESGSFNSIVGMAAYDDRLRRSCTRVMAFVEERQAARAVNGRLEDLDEVPLAGECFLRPTPATG